MLSETKLLRRRFDNAKVGSLYTMGKLWFVFVSITAIAFPERQTNYQSFITIAKIGKSPKIAIEKNNGRTAGISKMPSARSSEKVEALS